MEAFLADVDALEVKDSCGCCVQEPSIVPFRFNTTQFLPTQTGDDNSLPTSTLESYWVNQMKSFKDCRKSEHMDCVPVGLTSFRSQSQKCVQLSFNAIAFS